MPFSERYFASAVMMECKMHVLHNQVKPPLVTSCMDVETALRHPASMRMRIQQLRNARGLTQEELGHRAGLDQSNIARMERSAAPKTFARLVRVDAALGGAGPELFGGR